VKGAIVTTAVSKQDDTLEFELFDWDLEGSDDAMGVHPKL
jgi:hypothetical protein